MAATWARLRALDCDRPWLLDSVLAVLLFTGAVLAAQLGEAERAPDAGYLVLVALGSVPYVARRRAPLAVLVAASLPVLTLLGLGYTSAVIGSGLFLAAYSVAAWSTARASAVAGTYVTVVLVALTVLAPDRLGFGEIATNVALFAGALALGRAINDRRRTAVLLAERAELAERARAEEARRAVADERLRIAQELHDVIGHTLGVIALQAGVGAHVLDSDPSEARQCLVSVSERSRAALGEIRHMLGALRTDEATGYAPPPGLDALPGLVADMTAAGLPVELHHEGSLDEIPAGLGLTAYRLVQEALTNVAKHAGSAHATVTLRCADDELLIEVTDDGVGTTGAPATAGHGQLGMSERVAVWGGTLRLGPRPEGGYQVSARLPVEASR